MSIYPKTYSILLRFRVQKRLALMRQSFFAPCAVYSLRGRTPSNTPASGLRPPKCQLFFCFGIGSRRLGTGLFATCCYSGSYKLFDSRPAFFRGGWELFVLQVIDNQLDVNRMVPDLGKSISGKDKITKQLIFQIRKKADRMEESSIFSIFALITTYHWPITMNSQINVIQKDYLPPFLRVIDTNLETSFLQSNLEPIGGGDDPDIDW